MPRSSGRRPTPRAPATSVVTRANDAALRIQRDRLVPEDAEHLHTAVVVPHCGRDDASGADSSPLVFHNGRWYDDLYPPGVEELPCRIVTRVDGASRLRQLWHITVPGIRGLIILLLILRLGASTSAEAPHSWCAT